MNKKSSIGWVILVSFCLFARAVPAQPAPGGAASNLGLFSHHGDVGTVLHAGSVKYNASTGAYTVSGSGANMWSSTDDFQFVWKKVSSDVTLAANVHLLGSGGIPDRKAVLMVRQSLAPDSVYADAALHGTGIVELQFREAKGGETHEVAGNIRAPQRLRIEKRGDYFYMFLGEGKNLALAAGTPQIRLKAPFYVGLGVCSHDQNRLETAVFSDVDLKTSPAAESRPSKLYSTLETVAIGTGERQEVYTSPGRIEAPNWTHDGKWLLFNRDGHIEKIPVAGGTPEIINTGFADHCNNDHGISPDGASLAISNSLPAVEGSLIYIVPLAGGTPRRVTERSAAYFHGWSPDGKTLAFCGAYNGRADVYTIPAAGGKQTQLTKNEGYNDGPDYSPDGKYIYFNSDRTGLVQIWRMHADGSHQERVTNDDTNDWFPHISPDGKWMVMLSFPKEVTGHPANKNVELRIMSMNDMKITTLARLFGGQGTINVPSWSPDSRQVAFVSYHLLPE